MEARDKVGILLLLHDLLELERKPTNSDLTEFEPIDYTKLLLARDFSRIKLQDILVAMSSGETTRRVVRVPTLIIMTSVDWKRVGFAAGSKTDALDWND